jgi:hypothetical protein
MPRATLLLASLCAAFALTPATGCVVDHGRGEPPDQTCAVEPTYGIDTGASIDHVAGVDAGYYVEYRGGGAWHVEWTCDTKLSAYGCNFTGSIVATITPGSSVTCAQCEADDFLTVAPDGAQTTIAFDTVTSSGIDGIDFTTPIGSSIEADVLLDGIHQNDLVFLPSLGQAASPTCQPATLAPGAETPSAAAHLVRPQR